MNRIDFGVGKKSVVSVRKPPTKLARAKSTLAVMAIWPIRLNQPVVHDHNGALRLASFADQ